MRYKAAWKQTMQREAYLPQLEEQITRTPNDGALLAILGTRLTQTHSQSDEQKAVAILTQAIDAGDGTEAVWLAKAAALALQGDVRQVVATLQNGQEALHHVCPALDQAVERTKSVDSSTSPDALFETVCPGGLDELADITAPGSFLNGIANWWGKGHPEESGFTTRQQWAHDTPNDTQVMRLWGLALLRNRRIPEAAEVLSRVVAAAPDQATSHLAYAQVLEATGQFGTAVSAYTRALELKPDDVSALVGLGNSALHAGLSYDRQAFLRAAKIDPGSIDAWIGLGHADVSRDEFATEAVHAFAEASRLAPNRQDFTLDYAYVLNKTGQASAAEAMLRRYLAANPNDARAHYGLGDALLQNNPTPDRLAEAEQETRTALRLGPHQVDIERNLGAILLRQGKPAAAIQALEDARSDNPRDFNALRVLARAYSQTGQAARSQQLADEAARLSDQQQQLNTLLRVANQRFLEPAYHEKVIQLYRAFGRDSEAEQEQHVLDRLQQDPEGTAKSFHQFQEAAKRVLGSGNEAGH